MKSILQSIKPQYCELIASGKKTIEVRKTRPKLDVPFKVHIYCTKSKKHFQHNRIVDSLDDLYRMPNGEIRYGYSGELMCCNEPYTSDNFLNGKVIGEYVCDEITEYTYFEYASHLISEDELFSTGITFNELLKYGNKKPLYLWHISHLKIYDKPKELSRFYKPCGIQNCIGCRFWFDDGENFGCKTKPMRQLIRPPQSWCYVEEV